MGEVMEGDGVNSLPKHKVFGLEYFYIPQNVLMYTRVSENYRKALLFN